MRIHRYPQFSMMLFSMVLAILMLQACKPEAKPNFVWIISEDNSTHYMELFDPGWNCHSEYSKQWPRRVFFSPGHFPMHRYAVWPGRPLNLPVTDPEPEPSITVNPPWFPCPMAWRCFHAYLRDAGYYTTNNSKEDYNYIRSEKVWDESSNKAHWRNREPGQPFFHKESHGISHESQLHFSAELMENYTPVTDPSSVHLFPEHPDTELFRFTAAYYRDKILGVDSIVGSVIKKLEDDGLLESTFIFYFGDHGGVLPGSKGYAYETGLHVPLVVRIPENFRHLVHLSPGSESKGFVSFVDFGPTLLELAGLELPSGIDGIPFMGKEISSQELGERNLTFGYADRFDEKYDMVRTARKGRTKIYAQLPAFQYGRIAE